MIVCRRAGEGPTISGCQYSVVAYPASPVQVQIERFAARTMVGVRVERDRLGSNRMAIRPNFGIRGG